MSEPSPPPRTSADDPAIAQLLARARAGDAEALAPLYSRLYEDLRRMARARLRDARVTLLDTTSLVHESFERIAGLETFDVRDRAHFFAYASTVMRSVIVDAARRRNAERRGGGEAMVTLTTGLGLAAPGTEPDVLRVHEALDELAAIDGRLARVVEMRYFGGLSHDEIARALDVSGRTVERDWEKARSFLYVALGGDSAAPRA